MAQRLASSPAARSLSATDPRGVPRPGVRYRAADAPHGLRSIRAEATSSAQRSRRTSKQVFRVAAKPATASEDETTTVHMSRSSSNVAAELRRASALEARSRPTLRPASRSQPPRCRPSAGCLTAPEPPIDSEVPPSRQSPNVTTNRQRRRWRVVAEVVARRRAARSGCRAPPARRTNAGDEPGGDDPGRDRPEPERPARHRSCPQAAPRSPLHLRRRSSRRSSAHAASAVGACGDAVDERERPDGEAEARSRRQATEGSRASRFVSAAPAATGAHDPSAAAEADSLRGQ